MRLKIGTIAGIALVLAVAALMAANRADESAKDAAARERPLTRTTARGL